MKLNVMLVEGDTAAISSMERMLSCYDCLTLSGTFSNPKLAMEVLNHYPIDAIFLDMDIPYINGLEIAARMNRLYFNTEIVFITTEPHYAVEAFNLNAIDYIMKPVVQSRLDQTIRKLQRRWEKRNLVKNVVK